MGRMTQKKGDLALSYAIYLFTKVGWEVSLPLSESLTYDLVVDDGDLHKVQVKYLGKDVRYVDMRKVHSNAQGYVVNRYEEGDYNFEKSGPITKEILEEYLKKLQIEVEALNAYQNPFDAEALSDAQFGL